MIAPVFKTALATIAVASVNLAGGVAHADSRQELPRGCSVSSDELAFIGLNRESLLDTGLDTYAASCTFVALPGYGALALDVWSGSAQASVTCSYGGATLSRGGTGTSTATYYRAGSCTLVLQGQGSGSASAS